MNQSILRCACQDLSNNGAVTLRGVIENAECNSAEAFEVIKYLCKTGIVADNGDGVFSINVSQERLVEFRQENGDWIKSFAEEELREKAAFLDANAIKLISRIGNLEGPTKDEISAITDIEKVLFALTDLVKYGLVTCVDEKYYCHISPDDYNKLIAFYKELQPKNRPNGDDSRSRRKDADDIIGSILNEDDEADKEEPSVAPTVSDLDELLKRIGMREEKSEENDFGESDDKRSKRKRKK